MNNLLNQARAAAAQGAAENMTETTKGGGARVLPEGMALARFTSYIEKGSHVQTFNGEAKAPAPQFQLGFTIVGGRGINTKGEPENMVQGDVFPSVNSYDISLSRFNSQPPEGGWFLTSTIKIVCKTVSTHSRPTAAGPLSPRNLLPITLVSTPSRTNVA